MKESSEPSSTEQHLPRFGEAGQWSPEEAKRVEEATDKLRNVAAALGWQDFTQFLVAQVTRYAWTDLVPERAQFPEPDLSIDEMEELIEPNPQLFLEARFSNIDLHKRPNILGLDTPESDTPDNPLSLIRERSFRTFVGDLTKYWQDRGLINPGSGSDDP